MLLRDEDINDLIVKENAFAPPPKPIGSNPDRSLQIQPASLDLTIGGIYRPDAELGSKGSVSRPIDKLGLQPGHTAVVETLEALHLPSRICAIGFPPHHISSKGILMTNPGHVDPGYSGKMSFTVINMGRDTYPLAKGDGIVTLLFFKLDAPPKYPYPVLYPQSDRPNVGWDVLHVLSEDFLNVDQRARKIARKQARRAAIAGSIVALIVGLVTVFGYIFASYNGLSAKVNDLDKQIAVLHATQQSPKP